MLFNEYNFITILMKCRNVLCNTRCSYNIQTEYICILCGKRMLNEKNNSL